jgi:hypothetical protein
MKTTKRFNAAITKLYNAFHKGELNPNDCMHCAVGNLCDNSNLWAHLVKSHYGRQYYLDNYKGQVKEVVDKTGYSPQELLKIEDIFLTGCDVKDGDFPLFKDKNHQFNGLCAVVEYLCELDNIPNVMEIQSLFEISTTKQVNEVLV